MVIIQGITFDGTGKMWVNETPLGPNPSSQIGVFNPVNGAPQLGAISVTGPQLPIALAISP
jgi:hypothetical protein